MLAEPPPLAVLQPVMMLAFRRHVAAAGRAAEVIRDRVVHFSAPGGQPAHREPAGLVTRLDEPSHAVRDPVATDGSGMPAARLAVGLAVCRLRARAIPEPRSQPALAAVRRVFAAASSAISSSLPSASEPGGFSRSSRSPVANPPAARPPAARPPAARPPAARPPAARPPAAGPPVARSVARTVMMIRETQPGLRRSSGAKPHRALLRLSSRVIAIASPDVPITKIFHSHAGFAAAAAASPRAVCPVTAPSRPSWPGSPVSPASVRNGTVSVIAPAGMRFPACFHPAWPWPGWLSPDWLSPDWLCPARLPGCSVAPGSAGDPVQPDRGTARRRDSSR